MSAWCASASGVEGAILSMVKKRGLQVGASRELVDAEKLWSHEYRSKSRLIIATLHRFYRLNSSYVYL